MRPRRRSHDAAPSGAVGRAGVGGDRLHLREIFMSAQRRMARGSTDEPESRIGICCGDRCQADAQFKGAQLLFKVQGFYRYRCDRCFQAEIGRRHYLAAHAPVQS